MFTLLTSYIYHKRTITISNCIFSPIIQVTNIVQLPPYKVFITVRVILRAAYFSALGNDTAMTLFHGDVEQKPPRGSTKGGSVFPESRVVGG